MEVESFTKQQIFDTMVKLVNDQKAEAAVALAAHQQATQEHQRITLDALNEIRADLGEIQLHLERGGPKAHSTAATTSSPPATPRDGEIGPSGHIDDKFRRGKAHESTGLYVPPPARGANPGRSHPPITTDDPYTHHRSIPKIDFPRFDGVCPKLWQQRCEDYFSLYGTHRSMWITVATMQFEGAAARWLQSVQRKLPQANWEEFCGWIVTRFGRNQHQALLRQLYHINQTSTVVDYVEKFAELIDQLAAYEPNIDNLHYTTRFLDGLVPHIRALVAIQRPHDLDTAHSLALLQEEVGGNFYHGQHRQMQLAAPSTILVLSAPPTRRPLPLPAPPVARPIAQAVTEVKSVAAQPHSGNTDDKWAALRAYRRARGQCFTCGERYSRDHQFKGTVSLHVIQEVLELFSSHSEETDQASSSSSHAELQLMLADTVIKKTQHSHISVASYITESPNAISD